ncbi:MAG: hypothetical protein LH615_03255 [Ferruginibacter sp.]|nr:hypothetical protein [Ferruginibacter sp.]
MKNNLFDKYIKEHLGAARPDVAPHIWENIIAKKDRKKPVGYFANNITKIAAAILFILTSAGGAIYLLSHKNIAKNKQNITAELNTNKTNNSVINKNNNNIVKRDVNPIQDPTAINDVKKEGQNFTYDNMLHSSKPTISILINAGDEYDENEIVEVTDRNEPIVGSKFFLNDLLKQKHSFNPTLQVNQLPGTPFIP